jgi:hypothetical protein
MYAVKNFGKPTYSRGDHCIENGTARHLTGSPCEETFRSRQEFTESNQYVWSLLFQHVGLLEKQNSVDRLWSDHEIVPFGVLWRTLVLPGVVD